MEELEDDTVATTTYDPKSKIVMSKASRSHKEGTVTDLELSFVEHQWKSDQK